MVQESMWGKGDAITLRALKHLSPKGKWLILAAGDGRYISSFKANATEIMITDKNSEQLKKLKQKFGKNSKYTIVRLDITKKFALKDNFFDGVLCTGTLHLFSPKMLQKIIKEICRVLKREGTFIFDFATDIQRKNIEGKVIVLKGIHTYNQKDAQVLVQNLLPDWRVKTVHGLFSDDMTKTRYGWIARGNFLLVIAKKQVK